MFCKSEYAWNAIKSNIDHSDYEYVVCVFMEGIPNCKAYAFKDVLLLNTLPVYKKIHESKYVIRVKWDLDCCH